MLEKVRERFEKGRESSRTMVGETSRKVDRVRVQTSTTNKRPDEVGESRITLEKVGES